MKLYIEDAEEAKIWNPIPAIWAINLDPFEGVAHGLVIWNFI